MNAKDVATAVILLVIAGQGQIVLSLIMPPGSFRSIASNGKANEIFPTTTSNGQLNAEPRNLILEATLHVKNTH